MPNAIGTNSALFVARDKDRALVDRMVALLDLVQIDPMLFEAPGLTTAPRRLFGGQLVAQALAAATRTVAGPRLVHSVHSYFVRSGVTTLPLHFAVSVDAEGTTHSFRRVLATQAGETLLSLSAAFQVPFEGLEHAPKAPVSPDPSSLQDDWARSEMLAGTSAGAAGAILRGSPFQFRTVMPEGRFRSDAAPARQRYWFRTAKPLSDASQDAQRILLTYASDTMLLGAGLMPHGLRWFDGNARVASLDHAVWIHRDVNIDDWLLYDQESPWAGDGRSLNRGHIFDRQGLLVATVVQEGSMRRASLAPDGA